MIGQLLEKIRSWFRKESLAQPCFQCGFPPGREFLIATAEPIMHPHQCLWCKSILYVPGTMFSCKACSAGEIRRPAA
jgi:hypothetical protein